MGRPLAGFLAANRSAAAFIASAFFSTVDRTCWSTSHALRKSHAAAVMRPERSANVGFSIVAVKLAGNVDLFRSAAPKDTNNEGSRLGEQSQGLPLDGEPRLPKWEEERSGATVGSGGGGLRSTKVPRQRSAKNGEGERLVVRVGPSKTFDY